MAEIISLKKLSVFLAPILGDKDLKNKPRFGEEIVAHWLRENYDIDYATELANALRERDEDSKNDPKNFLKKSDKREEQFVEYVRRTREKALLANQK